jgi:hypothetical protein
VKTLPDSPNMGHLRQQAKDVLVRLRSTRPDATLSDAQAVIAEKHGFRTWIALKEEVDHRNASPRHAPAGVAEALAHVFDLGTPTGPLVSVERQWAGQAWSLSTDRGRWLARELFDWYDGGDREVEVMLSEAAAAAGIETPRSKRSRNGAVIDAIEAGEGRTRWRVFEWMSLGPMPTTPVDVKHAAAAGAVIGRVHALALPPPRRVDAWLRCRREEAKWWDLHDAAARAAVPWADAFAAAIPAIVDVSTVIDSVDPNDAAVLSACHYAPDAFRTAGDDLVFVTWEYAGAMPPRWDLGHALARWSAGVNADDVNEPAALALLEAYRAEARDVDVGQLDLGIFSADISAALNWTASRINIALTAGDSAQRAAAEREISHLLAAPPSRLRYGRILDVVTR